MEILKAYYPFLGMFVFVIGSIIAVRVGLEKRPTYKDMHESCQQKNVCDEIHKSTDEKLKHIPEIMKKVTQIETKIDFFLEKNGK